MSVCVLVCFVLGVFVGSVKILNQRGAQERTFKDTGLQHSICV